MTGESNKGSPSNADLTGSSDSSWELVNVSGSSDSEANSGGDLEVPPFTVDVTASVKAETNDESQSASTQVEGEVHLYPVSVKTLSGEKLELQLSPGDSVIDVRQFLLDAPETCFVTCYDLILHIKDGSEYPLEDYKEISEVADITTGGCSLEMIAAFYDDRSIRSHVRRVRDLLTLSTLYTSLSTLLVLQHEATEQKGADALRLEAPELDGLSIMEDVSGSMHNLIASSRKEIKCIESIVFSSFNPPPSYRRLVGDLIYLDVVTLEGNKFCITGTSKHFYVNSSTGDVLDPLPSKAGHEANTLVELLQKISSEFKKGFREILERKTAAHPFENVQPPLSQNPWLDLYPIPDHKRDAARAEESLTISYGSELIGMQRDWNEELQSCRDFPHSVPQERILRDRALYKVTCDFVEAATNGAIGVINRCIPPINPTDPECFHMYVHNNIFFSFAVDTDLEQVIKDDVVNVKLDVGTKHSEDSTSPDSSAKASSTIKDIPSEAQIADSEQATYASANNDLKGTKAYQEADVPGLYNLAMAIIDYRGYRVVAQSIIPGILQGDKSDSLLYGSVDNGKKICWDESFHSKVVQAAKRLHLKEHAVRDGSGKVVKLAAPVECKGIVGSDDRQYLLDLMRVTPRDANYQGPGSRFLVLRPELVDSFCRNEAADRSNPKLKTGEEAPEPVSTDICVTNSNEATDRLNSKLETGEEALIEPVSDEVSGANLNEAADRSNSKLETGEEAPIEPVSDDVSGDSGASLIEAANTSNSKLETREEALLEPVSDDVSGTNLDASVEADTKTTEECVSCPVPSCPPEEILLNPNVFTDYTLAGSEEEIAADEACVRKASSYLIDTALPKFVEELCALEMSPLDGQTLIELLHANGINVRYLGKVANMTRNLPHLWDICATEVVVRSGKHILKDLLRESQDNELGSAISHFLNCFIGDIVTVGTKDSTDSTPTFQKSQESHQSPRKHVKGQMRRSHGTSSTKSHLSYMDMTSAGLWFYINQFARAKYQFEVSDEARLQVKKVHVIRNLCQKVGVTIAARKYDLGSSAPFQTSDILNLQPVVKHTVPTSSDARDLMDTGKARLAEGMLNEAYTLFSEAFNILQQVTGPMHREVSTCCRYLAMVLYHAGDMQGAILQQNKELIINERCLGLDHPDTYHSYANMALFYHGVSQTKLALRHMFRALLILSLSSGPDHPDVSATFINVAMMYQDSNNMNTALRYLQAALRKNERLFGKDHVQTAVCYHALAIAFNAIGAFKLSVQNETITYDVLLKELGKDDSRTQDSENWLKIFKIREQQAIAQKQKSQSVCSTSEATTGVDFVKAYRAYYAAAVNNNISATANKSINSALIAEALPRRRGVDERAARAAAEVRKKALAKGLQLRPSGGLHVNSGAKSYVAPAGTEESDAKKEVSEDLTSNGSAKNHDPAPVGLGAGLASLDSKKQKPKPKPTQ